MMLVDLLDLFRIEKGHKRVPEGSGGQGWDGFVKDWFYTVCISTISSSSGETN